MDRLDVGSERKQGSAEGLPVLLPEWLDKRVYQVTGCWKEPVREHTRLYFGGVMLEMRSRDVEQGLGTGLEWGALGWKCDRSRQHPSRVFKAWNCLGPELEVRGGPGQMGGESSGSRMGIDEGGNPRDPGIWNPRGKKRTQKGSGEHPVLTTRVSDYRAQRSKFKDTPKKAPANSER